MSETGRVVGEGRVEVVRVGPVAKHPNADALSVTRVHGGYPVIFRSGEYAEGDLAVYVPVDSVVPDGERFAFLGKHTRIRAKRLRGVFSMGLLTKVPDPLPAFPRQWAVGDDAGPALGITRYEPPEEDVGDGDEPDPGLLPVYGVEGLRRWPDALVDGEEVQVSEKIHGESARYVHDGARLWVGSRTKFKKDSQGSQWWKAARRYDLAARLAEVPGIGLYGETHGYTGGFPYGEAKGEVGLRFFDAIETKTRRWLNVDEFRSLCTRISVPVVPILCRGPWSPSLRSLAEGQSTLDASHVREGFVVRPVVERYDAMGCGRVILKMHGEGFLAR